jgi:tetratricopeptide (TPR) repeat protein
MGKSFIKGIEYIIDRNLEGAIRELKKIILDGDENLEIYILIGSLMRKKGEYEKAIHMHEVALNIKNIPQDIENYIKYELIKDYQEFKDYEKALVYLSELLQKDKSHVLLKQMALMKMYLKKYDEAISSFIKYQKISGNDVSNYIIKCHVDKLNELKEKKSADFLKFLKKSLKLYPDNRNFYLMQINYFFEIGKNAKAVELTKEFMEKGLIKSESDLDLVKSVFFDYLNIDTFVKAVLKKVAANDTCPLYYLSASDYFMKADDPRKSIKILKDYINNFGYKNIIVKKYAELQNEEVLLSLYNNKDNYICGVCNKTYKEFSEECYNCGSLNSIDFA